MASDYQKFLKRFSDEFQLRLESGDWSGALVWAAETQEANDGAPDDSVVLSHFADFQVERLLGRHSEKDSPLRRFARSVQPLVSPPAGR